MMAGMKNPIHAQPSRGRREPAPPAQPRKPRAGNDPAQSGPDLPGWLPAEALPPNVRSATGTLAAAYRRFVRDAPGELERAVGSSLVQLMWIELVNQGRLAAMLSDPSSIEAITYDADRLTDRSLELLGAKCATAELMLKIRMADEAINRLAALPTAPPPAMLEPPADDPPTGDPRRVGQVERSPTKNGETDRWDATTILPTYIPDRPAAAGDADAPMIPLFPPLDLRDHFATDSLPPRVTLRPPRPTMQSDTPNPPSWSPKLTETQPVDQLDHAAICLVSARPDLFARQGSVAATCRYRDGKRIGPYYRLAYREDGRQWSVYLGRAGAVVERVRQILHKLQQPLRQWRMFRRVDRQARAAFGPVATG